MLGKTVRYVGKADANASRLAERYINTCRCRLNSGTVAGTAVAKMRQGLYFNEGEVMGCWLTTAVCVVYCESLLIIRIKEPAYEAKRYGATAD